MSELSVLFDGALAARRVPSTGADREVLVEALVKNAGRKRTVRAVGQSVLVATAVAVVGLTSWAVVSNDRDPANPPIVTPSPLSPTPSVTVSPSPDPTASPQAPAIPTDPDSDWGALSDDIPDEAYPAMAPNRGDGFPEAHVMEPWVWDKTGPLWAVTIITSGYYWDGMAPEADVYAYLISPEGRYFELTQVAQGASDGWTFIRSWHEGSRTARISYNEVDAATGAVNGKGGLLNLETGAIEESSMSLDSGRSTGARFIAGVPSGREWWLFHNADATEWIVASWSESEGWTRVEESHLTFVEPQYLSILASSGVAYLNLDTVVDPTRRAVNLLVMDLASGASRPLSLPFPDWAAGCDSGFQVGSAGIGILCYEGGREEILYFTPDGSPIAAADWIEPGNAYEELLEQGQWVDPATGLTFIGEVESTQMYEVRSASGKVLASAPAELPRAGLWLYGVESIGPGLARIGTEKGGAFLVDLEQERLVAMVDTTTTQEGRANVRSLVFFGEEFDWMYLYGPE